LQKKGIQYWVDFKDLRPGQQWQQELDRAIENAQSFVILVAPKSQGTPWQEAEWRAVLTKAWTDSEKRVLPVVVGSSESPPFLRNWVSLKVDPALEPKTWKHRVVAALESTQSQTAHSLTAKSRRERERRLDEIGKAVATLEDPQLGDRSTDLVR
jgi:hypothetical protein